MAAPDEFVPTFAISETCTIALENIIRQTLINKVSESVKSVKFFWIHKKHRKKYDLYLDFKSFSSSSEMEFEKVVNDLKNNGDASTFIKNCEVVNFDLRQLGVQLERATVVSRVLNNINNLRNNYGRPVTVLNQQMLVHAFITDDNLQLCTLTDLRTYYFANLIKKIFQLSGCAVKNNFVDSKPGVCSQLNNCCGVFSSDKYLKFKKQLCESSNVSSHFMDAIVKLEHVLLDHNMPGAFNKFVFIISEKCWFKCQSLIKRWEEVTSFSPIPSFVYIKHETVNLIGEDRILMDGLYNKILDETKKSYSDKYDDMTDAETNEIFHCLTDFTLKMFFLTRLASHKIVNMKMDIAIRDAAFIMYNYARVCVLLQNFERKIQQMANGTTLLPTISAVDLTLLNKEEEWDLVLICAKYPDVMNEILKDLLLTSVLSSHKLANYLVELSHSLSVYYNRTNILADTRIHVQAILFARIHLIICVKIILENCFFLLDVKPITQM